MPLQSRLAERFTVVGFSNFANVYSRRLGRVILLAYVIPAANAALDMGRCCQLRARELLLELNDNPWTVCSIGTAITDPLKQTYASVNATKTWAMEHCPGYQLSSLDEWLNPLVQLLTPYSALLLLCPIRENDHEKKSGQRDSAARSNHACQSCSDHACLQECTTCCRKEDAQDSNQAKLLNMVLEWMNILGDPASAIGGAMSQLWMDFRAVKTLWSTQHDAHHSGQLTNDLLLGITIIGSQMPMNHLNSQVPEGEFAPALEGDIHTVLAAGTNFIDDIVQPVIIHFMTTAWGFYEAYQKLGDDNTAHSLAYGALYSWLLILVVVSNCFAVRANMETIKSSMKTFPLPTMREPLRRRYTSTFEWESWRKRCVGRDTSNGSPPVTAFGWSFYYKYLVGQLVGWICIAFFGSCAIVISYTTPTVGWGCRSFNHLLYILFSLIVALLQVLRHWVSRRYANSSNLMNLATRWIYTLTVSVNVFILLGGTIFHFCGLYQSYGCSRIFGPSSALLQLAPHTELHVHNSQRYWYSTGYVAYCGAWTICAIAVIFRQYIQAGLRGRFTNSQGNARDDIFSARGDNEKDGANVLTVASNLDPLEIQRVAGPIQEK